MKGIGQSVLIATVVLALLPRGGATEAPSDAAAGPRLDRGAKLYEKGDYEGARREFERETKQDPGSIPAWRGLGWSLWQIGEKERALKIWNDLLKVRPNEPEILLALAQAHEQRQEWDHALGFYDRLLEGKSRLREARLGRARIFQALRKYPPAEREVQAVLAISPNDVDAQFVLAGIYGETGRRKDAEAILQKLAALQPGPKYFRALGDTATELGKFDEAIQYYQRALRMRPDRGTTVGLFRAYARSRRYAEATQLLKGYLASHPGDDDVREQLGRVAGLSGHYAEAEREWRALIAKHPQESKWQVNLASLLHTQGRYDEAVETARRVVAAEPDNTAALGLLADDAFFSGREGEAIPWLERLVAVEPNVARLNQLANIHLGRGDRFSEKDDGTSAKREYGAAAQAYAKAHALDPIDSEAAVGQVTALRLLGETREAVRLAEQLHSRYPRMDRAVNEIEQAYSQTGDFARADRYIQILRRQFSNHFRFEHEHARALFFAGEREEAIEAARALLRRPIRPNIPVLLYHGVTVSKRENTVSLDNFADQMRALKREGYQAITVGDLVNFLGGDGALPPKPILITFDDARGDSFENADPLLQETGFRATMFIPVAELDRHIAFYASWEVVRKMQETGRWEMQCHGFDAHRKIPVDAEGHRGVYLANRQWIESEKRLETLEEYQQRIDRDYAQCRESLARQIGVSPSRIVAYAFPFGDLGQKSLVNVPDAFDLNQRILGKHFRVAFVESPIGFVVRNTPSSLLPRFEVPRDYSGADLLWYLRTNEPLISTLFVLADFYSWSGRYAEAIGIYDQLARDGTEPAMLLERRAGVFAGRGDFAGARNLLQAASGRVAAPRESRVVAPESLRIAAQIAALDWRIRPTLQTEGQVYSDNNSRSNFSVGPSGRVHLSDRLSLSARYRFDQFTHNDFDLNKLMAAPSEGMPSEGMPSAGGEQPAGESGQPATTQGTALTATRRATQEQPAQRVNLRADGNEAEAELAYMADWSTGFALSGGVAQFTDRSSPRFAGSLDTVPLGSGMVSVGLNDATDLTLGASHGYVGSAGTILQNLNFSGSLERLRWRPMEWLTFTASHGFTYYDDRNRRNKGIGNLTGEVWKSPLVELGYQFTYDDALRDNPFFFTPDQFVAHEGVFRLQKRFGNHSSYLGVGATVTAGVGKERRGDPEAQASALGEVELRLADRFGLFGRGGRSQSARFRDAQGNFGAFFKF